MTDTPRSGPVLSDELLLPGYQTSPPRALTTRTGPARPRTAEDQGLGIGGFCPPSAKVQAVACAPALPAVSGRSQPPLWGLGSFCGAARGAKRNVTHQIISSLSKDTTQEQAEGRDAQDRGWGELLRPLQGRRSPKSPRALQPGSCLNPHPFGVLWRIQYI